MAVSPQFRDLVLELLEGLGPVVAKPMFGGAGLYLDGVMFALVHRSDVLYLRTDDGNRRHFEEAGMGPFVPRAGKTHTMPYHEAPPELFEDADQMCAWAAKALAAARRARARRKGGAKRGQAT